MKKMMNTPIEMIMGKKKKNMYPDKFGKPVATNLGGMGKVGMKGVDMILGNTKNQIYPKGIPKKNMKNMGKTGKVTPMGFLNHISKGVKKRR